ncbi:hypothetical protein SAMN05421687_107153 [Salimicrobium flavidum]|uniref:Uncharacterized protein n=2 Tax=Salimicrobium flavidum TaxID=570947 RepID=A0A1N7JT43_9BACI|nr:hypothetical protein SAMN05421687_107153 [Salimicrobium flavidum]
MMNLLSGIVDLTVLATFGVLFVGYSVLVYPMEVLAEKTNAEARENKLKYAPEL